MNERRPEAATEPLLRVSNLGRSYGDRDVLRSVNFSLSAGERVALLGPSGSGKSTLLNCLGGVDRPNAGEIRFDGVSLGELTPDGLTQWRREKVGTVFQFFHLLPTLTAAENVELPLQLLGWKSNERSKRVSALLDRVGLAPRGGAFPSELSGGERQRVALARALAARPRLLLADEPTGNLDSGNGARVLQLLVELTEETGAALIMATHSETAAAACHRRLELLDGRLSVGPPDHG